MIHAYLFVTKNIRDRISHSSEFLNHMHRINNEAGTNITVYHSFYAEAEQHLWRCNGRCRHRQPYFGMVKRAKNQAPGPHDSWWPKHMAECGGQFIKVREPKDCKDKKKRKDAKGTIKPSGEKDILNFKRPTSSIGSSPLSASSTKVDSNIGSNNNEGKSSTSNVTSVPASNPLNCATGFSDLANSVNSNVIDASEQNEIEDINKKYLVTSCPVCSLLVDGDINLHLDECLSTSSAINIFDEH